MTTAELIQFVEDRLEAGTLSAKDISGAMWQMYELGSRRGMTSGVEFIADVAKTAERTGIAVRNEGATKAKTDHLATLEAMARTVFLDAPQPRSRKAWAHVHHKDWDVEETTLYRYLAGLK